MTAGLRRYRDAVERIAAAAWHRIAPSFPARTVIAVANDHAGTASRHRASIAVASRLPRCEAVPVTFTDGPEAVDALLRDHDAETTVVLSLGGDGTHRSVLARTMAPVVRLPMGSGNDAAIAAGLEEAFERFLERQTIVDVAAVDVVSARAGHIGSAFNIASIGLDAFITRSHDRLRPLMPGNTYRLITDVAVLFYERIVALQPMGVMCDDVDLGASMVMLAAVGASGQRTYGDHMRVLPGDENVCIITTGSLRDKLRMKRLFYRGEHVTEPQTRMVRANRVRITYSGRLSIQMDGEALPVSADDFPLTMAVRERAARVVAPARIAG